MTYRTTCPQCTSIFRLAADQLDAAQGWVQCGVCGAAFDARVALRLEDGSPLPAPAAETPDISEAPASARVDKPRSESAPASAPDTHIAPPAAARADSVATDDLPQGVRQREASPDLPSIILIDPDLADADDPGPMPHIYPAPAARPADARPASPAPAPARTPSARIEYATPLPAARRPRVRRRPIPGWVWGTASAALLTLLLAQTAYFLRDTLVNRLPQTRPAFEQLCAVAGCALSLPKNLAQLQIIGSDLQTEASGRLKLVLTLGNRAPHVQAWPMLLLTLTDQQNRPLARRSFAPSEYLGDARRIAEGIPPRSEQALSLPLTVRDLKPMGFDLQLTY